MAVIVRYRGAEFECHTEADLGVVLRMLGIGPTRHAVATEAGQVHRGRAARPVPKAARNLLRVLETVAEAGPQGITAADLAAKVGLNDGRGLGGFAMAAGGLGVKFEEAIRRDRDEEGTRCWYPGPKLSESIQHLRSPAPGRSR